MLDVFIDMTNTAHARFGIDRGGRCAMGSALWEIGIPHDRLLRECRLGDLTEADQKLCDEILPHLRLYELDIAAWYDTMLLFLKDPQGNQEAHECAVDLMRFGKQAGINFIIASPLHKKAAVRTRELLCTP